MLSFEERLALLEKELATTAPEALLQELNSYEAKGPLAYGYLEEIEFNIECKPSAIVLQPVKIRVSSGISNNIEFHNDAYTESLAMAA
ncbi:MULTISPECIES: hypothetical protein [Vibrio]|jgi:hypothetical protein|uniref:hypothetical protein n=1 Tax=Vibrio TaxID=662 RepID=UPI001F3C513B|nr:hypothetical protein [Vibrio kanaloae]UIJ40532.1 hypothetical protein LWM38_12570 [Vibrio kanaloae]